MAIPSPGLSIDVDCVNRNNQLKLPNLGCLQPEIASYPSFFLSMLYILIIYLLYIKYNSHFYLCAIMQEMYMVL